ncbi:MAG: response regulator [Campylobacteraceae bacterium]|nr:response regulator [Campylobacteraceae bacterium]
MPRIKILIVEDESIVALDIRSALRKLNYEVTDMVTSYEQAIQSVKNNCPDIALLDINLQNSKDGIAIAKKLQKMMDISVVYLTAFSDDDTLQRAVKTNPLGYILKPFTRAELKSSLILAIHKMNISKEIIPDKNTIDLGFNYYYNTKQEQLYLTNLPVRLSIKENNLLQLLIHARGSILSFQDIEHQLWPAESISQSTLRTLIYRMRTKLEHRLIETIPSLGCKINIQKK